MNIYYVIIGLCAIVLIYILVTFNKLIKMQNLVKESFSTMDIYLKKRWDLIPNLVETVKEYAKYERETLEKVISERTIPYNTMSNNQKMEQDEKASKDIIQIIAISENYPELKANKNFIQLTRELSQIETDIANSRKYYNGTVRNYNNKVQMFPSNIVAFMFRFKRENMITIKPEERETAKVKFENE